jgi:hypothetical protein
MKKIWAKQAFFTLVEHGGIRILDALLTLGLIQILDLQIFGQFSVYQGWVMLLLLFLPALEVTLYRDYYSLKSSTSLSRILHSIQVFNYLKIAILLLFIFIFSFIETPFDYKTRISLLSLAFILPVSHSLYGLYREPLKIELQQSIVAWVSLLQRIAVLSVVFLQIQFKIFTLNQLIAILVAIYFLFGALWKSKFKTRFSLQKVPLKTTVDDIIKIFLGSVFWIHINGVLSQGIQTLDLVFLDFNHYALATISSYSLSLKASNFFQLVPVALVNVLGVYLAKKEAIKNHEISLIKKIIIPFALICVFLFFIGYNYKLPLLEFISRGRLDGQQLIEAGEFFNWHLAGVLILCISHPLATFLIARAPLKRIFSELIAPWFIGAIIIYWTASQQSVLVTAQSNILIYFLYFLLVLRIAILELKKR